MTGFDGNLLSTGILYIYYQYLKLGCGGIMCDICDIHQLQTPFCGPKPSSGIPIGGLQMPTVTSRDTWSSAPEFAMFIHVQTQSSTFGGASSLSFQESHPWNPHASHPSANSETFLRMVQRMRELREQDAAVCFKPKEQTEKTSPSKQWDKRRKIHIYKVCIYIYVYIYIYTYIQYVCIYIYIHTIHIYIYLYKKPDASFLGKTSKETSETCCERQNQKEMDTII